ncbi:MAG: NAD(P)/FAD-dependent oxidoreductase [Clostridia bacterium]|nr:NAD(P)/FAD-dependent oxidoreductase [Clostridia bacterium]
MNELKVVVIGGGPAGMMSAVSAARSGNEVVILEKMNTLGRKLLITGKGRCNITSSLDMSEFIQNVPGNGRFLYSCFERFTNKDIIELMEKHGVKVKEERGNRIFPVSDKSMDVLNAFLEELKQLKVKIVTNAKVQSIITDNINNNESLNEIKHVSGVEYIKDGKKQVEKADKVILATGGNSYQATGSTGDGYEIARKLGHTVTKIVPSLVPLEANNNASLETANKAVSISRYNNSLSLCRALQGLSLRNVGIKLEDIEKNKTIYDDFGEMLFTHFGISGPTILSGSAHLLRYKNVDELLKCGKVVLKIDLKPALSEEKLDARILRDFERDKNKFFKNSLNDLLPQKLIDPVVELSSIDGNKKVNEVTKQERLGLVKLLKNFAVTVKGFRPINEAIVTSGGISIKEINPKSMESKLVNGLFFAGEVIDVDAYTGGFNLQIAYSTGYVAGC